MSVDNLLATSIYSKLTGGTALIAALGGTAIYRSVAPDTATYPRVVFSHMAGGPDNTNPSDMRTAIYSVICWSTSEAQAGTIDALVSALLHKQTLSVTGYTAFQCVRETEINVVEFPPTAEPVHGVGAQYRIRLDD